MSQQGIRHMLEDLDWFSQMMQSLDTLYRSSQLCDTTLVTSEGHVFEAHSCVLAAASPTLHGVLDTAKQTYHMVTLNNISREAWQGILDFVYRGRLEGTQSSLKEVAAAARQLKITRLVKLCDLYQKRCVTLSSEQSAGDGPIPGSSVADDFSVTSVKHAEISGGGDIPGRGAAPPAAPFPGTPDSGSCPKDKGDHAPLQPQMTKPTVASGASQPVRLPPLQILPAPNRIVCTSHSEQPRQSAPNQLPGILIAAPPPQPPAPTVPPPPPPVPAQPLSKPDLESQVSEIQRRLQAPSQIHAVNPTLQPGLTVAPPPAQPQGNPPPLKPRHRVLPPATEVNTNANIPSSPQTSAPMTSPPMDKSMDKSMKNEMYAQQLARRILEESLHKPRDVQKVLRGVTSPGAKPQPPVGPVEIAAYNMMAQLPSTPPDVSPALLPKPLEVSEMRKQIPPLVSPNHIPTQAPQEVILDGSHKPHEPTAQEASVLSPDKTGKSPPRWVHVCSDQVLDLSNLKDEDEGGDPAARNMILDLSSHRHAVSERRRVSRELKSPCELKENQVTEPPSQQKQHEDQSERTYSTVAEASERELMAREYAEHNVITVQRASVLPPVGNLTGIDSSTLPSPAGDDQGHHAKEDTPTSMSTIPSRPLISTLRQSSPTETRHFKHRYRLSPPRDTHDTLAVLSSGKVRESYAENTSRENVSHTENSIDTRAPSESRCAQQDVERNEAAMQSASELKENFRHEERRSYEMRPVPMRIPASMSTQPELGSEPSTCSPIDTQTHPRVLPPANEALYSPQVELVPRPVVPRQGFTMASPLCSDDKPITSTAKSPEDAPKLATEMLPTNVEMPPQNVITGPGCNSEDKQLTPDSENDGVTPIVIKPVDGEESGKDKMVTENESENKSVHAADDDSSKERTSGHPTPPKRRVSRERGKDGTPLPSKRYRLDDDVNGERLLMRPWLREQVACKQIAGLEWLDKKQTMLRIPWKHASRTNWQLKDDACLYMRWAKHSGKYIEGQDNADPKRWKANFRCALNSLPDVVEMKDKCNKKGHNAFKVYKFLPPKQKKAYLTKNVNALAASKAEERGNADPAITTAEGVSTQPLYLLASAAMLVNPDREGNPPVIPLPVEQLQGQVSPQGQDGGREVPVQREEPQSVTADAAVSPRRSVIEHASADAKREVPESSPPSAMSLLTQKFSQSARPEPPVSPLPGLVYVQPGMPVYPPVRLQGPGHPVPSPIPPAHMDAMMRGVLPRATGKDHPPPLLRPNFVSVPLPTATHQQNQGVAHAPVPNQPTQSIPIEGQQLSPREESPPTPVMPRLIFVPPEGGDSPNHSPGGRSGEPSPGAAQQVSPRAVAQGTDPHQGSSSAGGSEQVSPGVIAHQVSPAHQQQLSPPAAGHHLPATVPGPRLPPRLQALGAHSPRSGSRVLPPANSSHTDSHNKLDDNTPLKKPSVHGSNTVPSALSATNTMPTGHKRPPELVNIPADRGYVVTNKDIPRETVTTA